MLVTVTLFEMASPAVANITLRRSDLPPWHAERPGVLYR